MKNKTCAGCGLGLQTTDNANPGYAPNLTNEYCYDCFRLKNYGVVASHRHPEKLPVLPDDSLVVVICSVLNLDLVYSYPIDKIIGDRTKVVYLINQVDLLPKSTNFDDLVANLTVLAKKQHVKFHEIILMSAKNSFDLKKLNEYLLGFTENNIYLIGVQNSGKTTIFKSITNDPRPLSLIKAGLTQETIAGKLENKNIYDTPGLYQVGYIHEFLPYETYKSLIPSKTIRPKIYNLSAGRALFFEGLFAITYLKGATQSFVCYFDNNLRVLNTKATNVANLAERRAEVFQIFTPDHVFVKFTFKITSELNQLTFADLGFIHFQDSATVEILVPKGLQVSLSSRLFK